MELDRFCVALLVLHPDAPQLGGMKVRRTVGIATLDPIENVLSK
jgi:hypothetical protein